MAVEKMPKMIVTCLRDDRNFEINSFKMLVTFPRGVHELLG